MGWFWSRVLSKSGKCYLPQEVGKQCWVLSSKFLLIFNMKWTFTVEDNMAITATIHVFLFLLESKF